MPPEIIPDIPPLSPEAIPERIHPSVKPLMDNLIELKKDLGNHSIDAVNKSKSALQQLFLRQIKGFGGAIVDS